MASFQRQRRNSGKRVIIALITITIAGRSCPLPFMTFTFQKTMIASPLLFFPVCEQAGFIYDCHRNGVQRDDNWLTSFFLNNSRCNHISIQIGPTHSLNINLTQASITGKHKGKLHLFIRAGGNKHNQIFFYLKKFFKLGRGIPFREYIFSRIGFVIMICGSGPNDPSKLSKIVSRCFSIEVVQ